ncbi:Glycosyltransferase involved in cell wall bisynthesis [Flavobacterium swingsii]|uniref:Glycosyltransferase involved in cell wall bisynthesis n=1 Tax=Flavobacterium swingsii TaxID=498292 RepID=A0A1I0Z683_9FLAO|nr:glycosyltransferase [Flavobacterium swingsii]SFB21061.1 Glycosyltransferase involved in cell wall bisynthesis [Flavobacterium swingsii]
MENSSLVSVIIPTYNREEYLDIAIQSVISQTYKNIEILVIDDGSKINYAEDICAKYKQCIYLYKENGGLSSARNFGVKNAKGKYIALLDDDDLFLNTKIEKQVTVLEKDKEIFCVHSAAKIINDNGVETGEIIGASVEKAHKRSGFVFWNALGVWVVKSPTPLFRKEVFDKIIFDEEIKVGEDVDFYQRMFYFFKVLYIEEPLAFYREGNDTNRLSKKIEKYVGIEQKMFSNFIKMGIKNPFTLYKIAYILANAGIRSWNTIFSKNPIKINRLNLIVNPFYYLKLPIKKINTN